jgi:hypothetical protein
MVRRDDGRLRKEPMTGGVRRLALERRARLRRPERHLERLAAWARSFEGVFPEPAPPRRPVAHWHLPVDQRLVDPPWAERAHQARAVQCLLDAAAAVRRARPAGLDWQRVYAAVSWPKPFGSEVGVFLDPDYGREFEVRDHPTQRWTPIAAGRSLAAELGLAIPEGFVEAGYDERMEEEDPDAPGGLFVLEREIWMIREPLRDLR